MRAVKSISIDSERRVIITFLDGSTETLYPNCIWCDSEALRQLIKDLLEEKADAIIQTIENVTVATFADGADEALIRKLLVSIDPIQEGSGDPSPENVRPISGRTGCYISKSSQTYPLVQGSIGDNDGRDGSSTTRIRTDYIPYSGESSLSFYCKNSKSTDRIRRIYWYNSLKEFINSNSVTSPVPYEYTNFTPPENVGYYRIVLQSSPSTESISPDERVLVVNPIITSVNWETEAGIVYGGTFDVVSGKLVVDRALINIATLQFSLYSPTYGDSFYAVISDKKVGSQTSICDCFKNLNNAYAGPGSGLTGVYCDHNSLPRVYFRPPDSNTTTLEEFKEWINNNTTNLCYLLAEPIEYQLTPQEITTLLGTNSIWADSGNILELEYVADTKLYIDESQSGTLGSSRQTISNPDLKPVSEKTMEDLTEAVKAKTAEKETQEETEDERGE